MQRIGVRERRARLGLRHRLAGGALAGDPVEVASSLVAVHSTDPFSVYLGLLARTEGNASDREPITMRPSQLIVHHQELGLR